MPMLLPYFVSFLLHQTTKKWHWLLGGHTEAANLLVLQRMHLPKADAEQQSERL